jgi:hypothetical protein
MPLRTAKLIRLELAAFAGAQAKGAVWTASEPHAKVAYRGWTSGGELRQALFKGSAKMQDARSPEVRETLSGNCDWRGSNNTTDYCGAVFVW